MQACRRGILIEPRSRRRTSPRLQSPARRALTIVETMVTPTYSPPSARLLVCLCTRRKRTTIGFRRSSRTNRPLSPTCINARGRRDCAGMMGDLQLQHLL